MTTISNNRGNNRILPDVDIEVCQLPGDDCPNDKISILSCKGRDLSQGEEPFGENVLFENHSLLRSHIPIGEFVE